MPLVVATRPLQRAVTPNFAMTLYRVLGRHGTRSCAFNAGPLHINRWYCLSNFYSGDLLHCLVFVQEMFSMALHQRLQCLLRPNAFHFTVLVQNTPTGRPDNRYHRLLLWCPTNTPSLHRLCCSSLLRTSVCPKFTNSQNSSPSNR